ncbi:hypothetical protein LUW75_10775 [Streptomyces sp. MRC013]|uniref:hypothetical protein n=1 Tax=Streptomyces sp. MRC013 TaxID=2898276 RepID=UPI002026DBAE|nr:hypothetical protein [Streptomyces sp. MRC013]URM90397.1 hypothetical protein LUW75_10775 [Streptomyces sp. MRC013]
MTPPLARRAALYWAARAARLQAALDRHGVPIDPAVRATYQRYYAAARAAGWTDAQITNHPTT